VISTGAPERLTARVDQLHQLVVERDLSALVCSAPETIAYVSGTYITTQGLVPDRLAFLIATRDSRMSLLVCNIEEALVRAESWVEYIDCYVEFERDPTLALIDVLERSGSGSGRIGVQAGRLSGRSLDRLRRELPRAEFLPLDADIAAIQLTKEPDEIEALAAAAGTIQRAIEGAVGTADPGISERGLAVAIINVIAEAGGIPMILELGAGERGVLVHVEPTDRVMQPGELFHVDIAARFPSGFIGDIARTGVVGEPSADQEILFAELRDAQRAVFELVQPGRPARDLYRRCRQEFERRSLPFWPPHIGHGLGIGLHEEPLLHEANGTALIEGMVLSIEPCLVIDDRRELYTVEDLVLVTSDGHRLLSIPQDGLLSLPPP
jgi:Xaa-Pro aminopeptidase